MLHEGDQDVLLRVLVQPATLVELNERQWDQLLPRARAARLLGRLAAEADMRGLMDSLPPKGRDHLSAAAALAAHHELRIRWELNRIRRALGKLAVPILLLKGAAYVAASLPPAKGRIVGDLDLMVPRASLEEVEAALEASGWRTTQPDPYLQRYYRTWMHELPPLLHQQRGTVIDLHHAILPPGAHPAPDPDQLWAASRPLGDGPFFVLAPTDMVLHSAVHLFNGDLHHAVRNLLDVADLLKRFGSERDFWSSLVRRAAALDLGRPLYYALRYCRSLLGVSIPDTVTKEVATHGPAPAVLSIMDRMLLGALAPTAAGAIGPRGAWLYYLRSQWLSMPLWLWTARSTGLLRAWWRLRR
jgi:hypothetical protein